MKHNQRRQPGNKMWAATHRSDTGSKNLDQTKLKRAWNREITTAVPKVNKTGWLLDLKKKKKMKWNGSEAHKPFSSQWALGFFFCVREHLNVQFLSAQVNIWLWRRVSVSGVPAGKHCVPALCGSRSLDKGLPWKKKNTGWDRGGSQSKGKVGDTFKCMRRNHEERRRRERQGEQKRGERWGADLALLWGSRYLQWAAPGLWMGRKRGKMWTRNFLSWLAGRQTPASDSPATHYPPPLCPAEEAERDAVKKGRTREKSSGVPG